MEKLKTEDKEYKFRGYLKQDCSAVWEVGYCPVN